MSDNAPQQPPGWYPAQGDPPGTQRYWDGQSWIGAPQPVPGATGPGGQVTAESNLATPGARIVGRIIDGVIWVVISVIVGGIFGSFNAVTSGSLNGLDDVSVGSAIFAGLLSTALVAGYEIFMVGSQGGTVGKLALGTRVVNADGSVADFQTGLRRMYLYIGVGVLQAIPVIGLIGALASLVISIAGLVMLFTDSLRQTPWDKVGQTMVVRK
jgi:uncharacterized RDD family membrane protein YckC